MLGDLFEKTDPTASPFASLVRVWLVCANHGTFQRDLDRDACEAAAKRLFRSFGRSGRRPRLVAPPAAWLRALDEYCATLATGGDAPRRIEGHYVVRRPDAWRSKLADEQPNHREFWMRHHQIVPVKHHGIDVKISHRSDALRGLAPPFDAAAGGFVDGVQPNWSTHPAYRCTALLDARKRTASVEALLDEARRREARVVVLPELTVDPRVLAEIQRWLQDEDHPFVLVAAGHVVVDSIRRNEAWLLSARGEKLITHWKLEPMRHGAGAGAVDEDIRAGTRLEVLAGPGGLVALAICLDFCESGGAQVATLWEAVGPALILVPSMGDASTNHAHDRRAGDLGRQHATRVLAATQHHRESKAWGLAWRAGKPQEEASPVLFLTCD